MCVSKDECDIWAWRVCYGMRCSCVWGIDGVMNKYLSGEIYKCVGDKYVCGGER